ncbi:carotenoid biosynthesis protein [Candidatus Micrarchaeota archaeon]|nr:carotenoid biosynthesis protein [Candidatus Micrarchaeota archaeon]
MLTLSFVLYELAWMAVFLFVIRHAAKQWGKAKTVTFFLPAIAFGFLLEWATQAIFQGYRYGEGFLVYILDVPLSVSITWATLLYIGYWLAKEKFRQTGIKASVLAAIFLVLVDALHFEPMAYSFGYWTWTNPGVWFSAPLNNFYGWFWVVVLYLTSFQWIDAQKWDWKKKLAAGLLAIVPATLALEGLLKLFKAVLGNR